MSLKYCDIPVTFVKAGDRIMVSGLCRIVGRVVIEPTTGDVTFFFDHGDYTSSVTYPPTSSITTIA